MRPVRSTHICTYTHARASIKLDYQRDAKSKTHRRDVHKRHDIHMYKCSITDVT